MIGRVGDSKSDPHDCYEELCHQTTQPSKVLWLTLESLILELVQLSNAAPLALLGMTRLKPPGGKTTFL